MNTKTTHPVIVIGTRVRSDLFNLGCGTVVNIYGEASPETVKQIEGTTMLTGGSATYDIILDSGKTVLQLEEKNLLGSGQWKIYVDDHYDFFATSKKIKELYKLAEDLAIREEIAKIKDSKEHEAMKQYYLNSKDHKHLTVVGSNPSNRAIHNNIRAELKKRFPNTKKFSVVGSDCDVLTISWVDGDSKEAVESVINMFLLAYHSGQLHPYYKKTPFNEVFGSKHYIQYIREHGLEHIEVVIQVLVERYGLQDLNLTAEGFKNDDYLDLFHGCSNDSIHLLINNALSLEPF